MKPFDFFQLSGSYCNRTSAVDIRRRASIVPHLTENYLLPPDAEAACLQALATSGISADLTVIRHAARLYRHAYRYLAEADKQERTRIYKRAWAADEPLIDLVADALTDWAVITERHREQLEQRRLEPVTAALERANAQLQAENSELQTALEKMRVAVDEKERAVTSAFLKLQTARQRIDELDRALRSAAEKNATRELEAAKNPAPSMEPGNALVEMPTISPYYGERIIVYGSRFQDEFGRLNREKRHQVQKAVKLLAEHGQAYSSLITRRYGVGIGETIPAGAWTMRANDEIRVVWYLDEPAKRKNGVKQLFIHDIFFRGDGRLGLSEG